MKIWRLKKNHDKRVRLSHPWVFSNELEDSPKGVLPGEPIELRDYKNEFLARGYGNPQSLIAFRALSFDPNVKDPTAEDFLISMIIKSWSFRLSMGFSQSFRLCFSEIDQLPGLIIDYYRLYSAEGKENGQALVVQLSSSGMDRVLNKNTNFFYKLIEQALKEKLSSYDWSKTAIVLRNDLSVRKLEGLDYEEGFVLKSIDDEKLNLENCDIGIDSACGLEPVLMRVDLIEGQKTGFFLDQVYNIQQVVQRIERILKTQPNYFSSTVRVLDLCCYAGHWSSQLAQVFKKHGIQIEATLVDVSEKALATAALNAQCAGAQVITKKMDVLEHLPQLSDHHYDIVISDPPAFIKNKKDKPTGQHAYFKLNTQALRLTKPRGLLVCCSCSGLLTEEEFLEAIKKAQTRAYKQTYCVARGGPSVDHPMSLNFPEGHYLKMYLFVVEPVKLATSVAGKL